MNITMFHAKQINTFKIQQNVHKINQSVHKAYKMN